MITEAELRQFVDDTKWLHSHYDEVLKQHNGQFIAIQDQRVLESGESIEKLRENLKQRHIDPHEIFIKYVKNKNNTIQ